jgi:preprotein translocase subunit SecD
VRRRLLYSLIGIVVVALAALSGNLIAGNRPTLGLDLQGGVSVTLEPIGQYDSASVDVAVEVIRQRVDSLGVAEPEIIRQGDTVVVNLPGVKEQRRALDLIGKTGEVLMRPVLQSGTPNPDAETSTTVAGTATTVAGATSTVAGATSTVAGATETTVGQTTTSLLLPTSTTPTESGGLGSTRRPVRSATTVPEPATPDTAVPASSDSVPADSVVPEARTMDAAAPEETSLEATPMAAAAPVDATSTTPTTLPAAGTDAGATAPQVSMTNDPGQQAILEGSDGLVYFTGPAGATGEVFENDAVAEIANGAWVVNVSLRGGVQGEGAWNALANECFNRASTCPTGQIAIVLDGVVISAPVVQTNNFQGSVQISGDFSESEAVDLAKILEFGAVPVQFDTPTAQTVSATLGEDSLQAAIVAGLAGVALVLAFLVFYYRRLAFVVIGGLIVSGMLQWSVISWLSQTNGLALSLAGVTGIIVSIGVTVDSYVVFFEKLKDDVLAGRTLRNSATRSFNAAWRTILAADTVSLLGAVVLWFLTVGSVRGFAFFLGLSTLCDMIIAYFFTRPTVILLSRSKWMNAKKVFGVRARKTSMNSEAINEGVAS